MSESPSSMSSVVRRVSEKAWQSSSSLMETLAGSSGMGGRGTGGTVGQLGLTNAVGLTFWLREDSVEALTGPVLCRNNEIKLKSITHGPNIVMN